MNKTLGYGSLIAAAAVLLTASFYQPQLLSDHNKFFKEFVNHELLNVLGVILAITLASAAQLHLKFNEIEEEFKNRGLTKTRSGVHQATYCLIILFLMAILIVIAKPIAANTELSQAIFNSAAIFILFWNVLILISLTTTTFSIKPHIKD